MYVRGSNALTFSNGGIGFSNAWALGAVLVDQGGTLNFTSAATSAKAHLTVGTQDSEGLVTVGGLSGLLNTHEANILVNPKGTFEMTQSGELTTSGQGGFTQSSTMNSGTFTNYGKFVREGATTGNYVTHLGYTLTNKSGGYATFNPGTSLRFSQPDLMTSRVLTNESGGFVQLYYGAKISSSAVFAVYRQDGGAFETYADPNTGFGTTWFEVKSEFYGGTLTVGMGGTYSTLDFGQHDVTFANSLYIYLDVKGDSNANSPVGDQIYVNGSNTLTIDNGGQFSPRWSSPP